MRYFVCGVLTLSAMIVAFIAVVVLCAAIIGVQSWLLFFGLVALFVALLEIAGRIRKNYF